MKRINELGHVTCKFFTNKVQNKDKKLIDMLVKSPNCIKVVDKEDPSNSRTYSVPQIKNCKIELAEQQGGTLVAVEKAMARGTQGRQRRRQQRLVCRG